MKPSTSERSVELARHEPSSSTSSAENKRNRLYAPLSALSSRLHINQPEQFRNTHSEEETGTSTVQPSTSRNDMQMLPKPKETASHSLTFLFLPEREVVFCNGGPSSASPARKPITMKNLDQRVVPSSSSGFPRKGSRHCDSERFPGSRVQLIQLRGKRPASTKDDSDMSPPSEPHVHKSETLTVIIPQRRAALSRQEPKPQSTKVPDSSPAVEKKLADVQMKQPAASSPDVEKSSPLPTTLPADEQSVAEKPSNGHSMNKDDLLPVSDEESGDELDDGDLIDPPVIKSTVTEGNFIPYSLDTHAFSNQHHCPRLLIHEQKFSSAEQFYMWTKARFFKDFNAANAILYLKDPKMIKQVDSQLKNVDVNQWMKFSWKVRMKAAMAKFKQNRRMRYQLFRTIGSTLVEANVDDTYWGVGLSSDDPNIADPSKWRGANVMGEVLMQIRDVLKEDPDYSDEVEQAKQNLFGSK
ncbi:hypothetical protein OSTOST_12184 [Ostertagia ostertagi]